VSKSFSTNFKYIQENKGVSNTKGIITDFSESKDNKKDFIATIEGIHVTVTGNHTKYTQEELKGNPREQTGVSSWTRPYNNPVLTHHDQYDGEPIGRVIDAKFSNSTLAGKPGIVLKARISDQEAIDKIKDGRYQTVSVGGNVSTAECSICGTDWVSDGWCEHMPGREYDDEVMVLLMKGITFVEVSFVNVPADEYAHLIAYDVVEDDEDTEFDSDTYDPKTAFEENAFNSNQGGSDNDMAGDNDQNNNLEEKLQLKNEKISLLEDKLSTEEDRVETLESEKQDLEDKIDLLENEVDSLENEVKELNDRNKELKDDQVEHLAEKIFNKKVELERIPENLPEEKEQELLDRLSDKSKETLEDILDDLNYEEELQEEQYDGHNGETDKNSKHNSDEDNVSTEDEDDEDEFDINKALEDIEGN